MSDAFNERLRLIRFRRKRERAKFTQELKIIPKWLVGICVALYVLAIGQPSSSLRDEERSRSILLDTGTKTTGGYREQLLSPMALDSRLKQLADACRNGGNVMPVLIDAVKDYASLGEISDVYRQVFGLYREPIIF